MAKQATSEKVSAHEQSDTGRQSEEPVLRVKPISIRKVGLNCGITGGGYQCC